MGALWSIARVELRDRWRVLLLLGLLGGLAGGLVLTAIAGARRSDTAFERSLALTKPGDVTVRLFTPGVATQVAGLPQVTGSWIGRLTIGQLMGTAQVQYFGVLAGPPQPPGLFTPRLVAGRAADPRSEQEAVIGEQFRDATGFDVGDTLDLKLLTPQEVSQFGTGFGEPEGPAVRLKVVGVVRVAGTSVGQLLGILATPAYFQRHLTDGGGDFVVSRLANGAADLGRLRAGIERIVAEAPVKPPGVLPPYDLVTPDAEARAAHSAARVVVAGLGAFAFVAGSAGLVALVQATNLFTARRRNDQRILATLGLTRAQRLGAIAAPAALVSGPVAALTAVAIAVAASPLTPIGAARQDEPSPGVDVNVAVLAVGAAALVFVVTGVVTLLAGHVARVAPNAARASTRSYADRLASAGAPPVTALGVRFALERGVGATAVPVRSTIAAAVLGVAGVVAAAGFAGTLQRTSEEPARYGYPADMSIADARDDMLPALLERPDVVALADVFTTKVRVGNFDAVAISFDARKGSVGPTMLQGRAPASPDEAAIGPAVARAASVGVGDPLTVNGQDGRSHMVTVVGTALTPGDVADDYDKTVLLTPGGFDRFGVEAARNAYLTFAPGTDVAQRVNELGTQYEVDRPNPPTSITNLRQVDQLPVVLAGFFLLVAAVAIVNATAAATSRRRRDLAVVRTIGFTPRQARAVITVMATTTALVGIVIGVPVGLVLASVLWRTVAEGVNVATDLLLPAAAIGAAAVGAVVGAALLSSLPAAVASRVRPGPAFRQE